MSLLLGLDLLWVGITTGASLTAALRRARARPAAAASAPPGVVLLLRPCAGDEPGLARRLGSSAALRSATPLHHRFTVCSPDDPAVPALQEAVARLRSDGHSADWQVHPPIGPNHKVSQLAGAVQAGLPGGDPPLAVVNVDSDVDLTGFPLDTLLAPLWSGAGATWAPPVEVVQSGSPGDRASRAVLGGSLHAFAMLRQVDPAGLVGKAFAVRTDALAAIGGFEGLARHLGEDMELSRRLRAAGLPVVAVDAQARSEASGRSLADTVRRFARWLLVIRAQRPVLLPSYPLLFAPLAGQLLLAGLAAALAPALWPGAALVATLALGSRLVTAALARSASALPRHPGALVLDVVLAEGVLLAAFSLALWSRRLSWRGQPLRIGPGGLLAPATSR